MRADYVLALRRLHSRPENGRESVKGRILESKLHVVLDKEQDSGERRSHIS